MGGVGVKSEGMEEQMGQENGWKEGKEVSDRKRKWKQGKREEDEMKNVQREEEINGIYRKRKTHITVWTLIK